MVQKKAYKEADRNINSFLDEYKNVLNIKEKEEVEVPQGKRNQGRFFQR